MVGELSACQPIRPGVRNPPALYGAYLLLTIGVTNRCTDYKIDVKIIELH